MENTINLMNPAELDSDVFIKSVLNMQAEILAKKAADTGDFREIAFFYASLRDYKKFDELRDTAVKKSGYDSMYFDLLDSDRRNDLDLETLNSCENSKDPWVYYTVTKYFLKRNMAEDAFDFLKKCVKKDISAFMSFTLFVPWCASSLKYRKTGLEAADMAIEFNHLQEDIIKARAAMLAGRIINRDFYLDSMPKQEKISFYIPMFNVEKYVKTAIEGILSLGYPVFEILAIDDGTQDNSAEVAAVYPVKIIKHPKNLGLAAARNTAFKNAKTSLVGAFDTDAFPSPDYMRKAMMELENRPENFAGFGGCLIELNQKKPADMWRAVHLAQHMGIKRIYNPDFLFGSNVIFDRDKILSIGGFDEKYRTNYEDVDTCRRLKKAGYKLVYNPAAQAYHSRIDDTASVLKTRWNWFYWSYHEKGYYDSFKALKGAFVENIKWLNFFVNMDIKGKRNALIPLDFLDFYFSLVMDLNLAVKSNFCSDAEAYAVYRRCMMPVAELDAKYGKNLYQKINQALEDKIRFRLVSEKLRGEMESYLKDYFQCVDGIMSNIDEPLYSLVASGI